MAESYLQQLKTAIEIGDVKSKTMMAGDWFRSLIMRAQAALKKETMFQKLVTDAAATGAETGRMWTGRMYFFVYNPKHRATLPYYDMFPLVIPIKAVKGGFLGINFHYLSPRDRAILLDEIKGWVTDKSLKETSRILLTYKMMQGWNQFERAAPCLKRYLKSHMRTQFIQVKPDEWGPALFLPVEEFKKATKQAVWADSKKIYGKLM